MNDPPPGRETAMKINCEECVMYRSSHCEDCLVTALLHAPSDPVEISDEMGPQLQALSGAGLIPVLRFRPRTVEGVPERGRASPEAPISDAG